jgi:hypothetical protein
VDTGGIIFLATGAAMLAAYGWARLRGSTVPWGGREKPGRIIGARVSIGSHEDQAPLPVQELLGTISAFDAGSNGYDVVLDDELRLTGTASFG